MSESRRKLGAFGEKYARAQLRRSGYRILASNVRLTSGEIDLVAQEGATLVFVEVRTRRGGRLGTPEESITAAKGQRLAQLAQEYLQMQTGPEPQWRIDVVAVEMAPDGKVSRLEVLKNAVGASGLPG